MKYLIINADDFGYSKIFNISILTLIKNGLITSTTVMVNWINEQQAEQVRELIELAKSHNVSIGLHFEFTNNNFDYEIEKQYEKFLSIFGFKPSHADLHKSVYLKEAYPIIMKFCENKNLPCRNQGFDNGNIIKTQNKVLNGSKMSLSELKSTIASFNDGENYEIFFHPGTYDPNCKSSMNETRQDDIKKIEKINLYLKERDIKLISFLDLTSMHTKDNFNNKNALFKN